MKSIDQLIESAITAFERRIAFAIYAEPGEDEFRFIADDQQSDTKSDTTFTIVPWLSRKPITIVHRCDSDELPTTTSPLLQGEAPYDKSTQQSYYRVAVKEIVSRLKRRGGKTVYSRVKTGEAPDILEVVKGVLRKQKTHFRSLYYHPTVGCWVTSTPEILVKTQDGVNISTMALAGTRSSFMAAEPWDDKNIEEQEIVMREIIGQLERMGIKSTHSSPYTHPSGSISHIRTDISAVIDRPEITVWDIALRLSPTPALGGYPRRDALTDIAELEEHPRRCYGGFVAVAEKPKSFNSYVVIRCAQVDLKSGKYCAYAGGGITAQSDPDIEWAETTSKLIM